MEFTREGIKLGLLFIHFYGVIIMSGVVLASFLAYREAKRRGLDPELVWDLLIWLIIGGVVGGRVWHIFTPTQSAIESGLTTQYYLTHPLDAIAVWNGGMGIVGGVVGGAIAMYFFARKYKLSFPQWADIASAPLALGQAVGRWGNFVNQELYGAPTDLPWAITIAPEKRVSGFEQFSTYHPLFLYESLWNLGNMLVLLWISRRFNEKLKPGDLFLSYLIIYPVGRFLLDFLRLDTSLVVGINANQSLMAVVAILAAIALIWRHRK